MIDVAGRVADEVLAPAAEAVDGAATVPATNLEALATAGLFGLAAPVEYGGPGVDATTSRRVIARIAGGCGATFFVWVQHHGVVRLVSESLGTDRPGPASPALLADLAAGRTVAGTAFAHIRRLGRPAVLATRVDGGWRLDGRAPWATSWGIADLFSVAAETDDGRMVWALLDVGPDRPLDGLVATPLPLPVLNATSTVAWRLDGCAIADDQVLAIGDAGAWRSTDRLRSALGSPAPLGIADRARRLLRTVDDRRALDVADLLGRAVDAAWADDEMLLGAISAADPVEEPVDEELVERLVEQGGRHRAATIDLARGATAALLAACGGRGMESTHPAQRLAREAEFYVVQAQTADGRAASLDLLAQRFARLADRG